MEQATALRAVEEIEALRTILKRVQRSPQTWARLSFLERADYWSADERAVLERAGLT